MEQVQKGKENVYGGTPGACFQLLPLAFSTRINYSTLVNRLLRDLSRFKAELTGDYEELSEEGQVTLRGR